MKKTTYNQVDNFKKQFGVYCENQMDFGFPTKELANEYARLKCDWWGSNLVYLGIQEINNLYFPGFNVWN